MSLFLSVPHARFVAPAASEVAGVGGGARNARPPSMTPEQTAQEVVKRVGGESKPLKPFAYPNTRAYFFSFSMPGSHAFLKIPAPGQDDVMRREARIAREAGAAGIGPPTFNVPGINHVLLSEHMGHRPLSAFVARQPAMQDQVIALLGRINALPMQGLQGPATSITQTAHNSHAKATRHAKRHLLNLHDVQGFIDAQTMLYQSAPFTPRVIHADVWHDNILIETEQQLRLIDWGTARIDDPLVDLGRFAVLADVAGANELQLLFKQLGRRIPEAHETQRFSAVLGLFEADYYCHYACAAQDRPQKPSLARFAARIQKRSAGTVRTVSASEAGHAA